MQISYKLQLLYNYHTSLLFLVLPLSCFLALSHTFWIICQPLTLLHDAWVLTHNQDQDTNILTTLISDLFWFSSRQLRKTCKKNHKGKRTLRFQMLINTCTTNLLSKQTESIHVLDNLINC